MSNTHPKLTEIKDVLRNYLEEKGKRKTTERFIILEEIVRSDDHISADELHDRLETGDMHVSRSTVYNTLDLLVDARLVAKHQFGEKALYETAYRFWQHDHLICERCGRIYEFCDPRMQEIQEMVEEIYDHEVERHALRFYGRCRREECRNR